MATIIDLPENAFAAWRKSTENKAYAAWTESYNLPVSSFWHPYPWKTFKRRSGSRSTVPDTVRRKGPKRLCLAQGSTGPLRLDQIPTISGTRDRLSALLHIPAPTIDDEIRHPGKNWPQGFYKCHPELKPMTLKPLE
jgi:hypothetical protein